MMEKLQGFAEGKYTIPNTTAEILQDFIERRGDVGENVDGLSITKRITSTGMFSVLNAFCL